MANFQRLILNLTLILILWINRNSLLSFQCRNETCSFYIKRISASQEHWWWSWYYRLTVIIPKSVQKQIHWRVQKERRVWISTLHTVSVFTPLFRGLMGCRLCFVQISRGEMRAICCGLSLCVLSPRIHSALVSIPSLSSLHRHSLSVCFTLSSPIILFSLLSSCTP